MFPTSNAVKAAIILVWMVSASVLAATDDSTSLATGAPFRLKDSNSSNLRELAFGLGCLNRAAVPAASIACNAIKSASSQEINGLPFFYHDASETPRIVATDTALVAATSNTESSKRLIQQELSITPLEAAIRGPMANFLKAEERDRIIAWLKSGAPQSEYESNIRPILGNNCLSCHSTAAAGTTRPDLSNFVALQKVIQVNSRLEAHISRNEAAAALFRKHNLTPGGVATGEICAFCHTPQGAEASAALPLWNRSSPPVSPYLAYASLGSATEEANGSVSISCLSCHDGTQAPNVLIRTPDHNADVGTGKLKAPDSVRADLRNHHPVGMLYSGGGQDQTRPTAPLGVHDNGGGQNETALSNRVDPPNPVDVDTFNNVDFKMTSYAGSGSGTVWWVESGKPHKERRKTDLYLFTRTDRTDYAGLPVPTENLNRPYVECATCHDVMGSNPTFLRFPNSGSAICLTCHNK